MMIMLLRERRYKRIEDILEHMRRAGVETTL